MSATKTRVIWSVCLSLLFALVFVPAVLAQKETNASLRSNPYRDIGGSCVYGKQREVLFAPKGSNCPDQTDHLSQARKAATPRDPFPSLPPAYKAEAGGLVSDHVHIAGELDELRQAIARNQKENALAIADKLIAELREHLTREEGFIDKLAAEHRTH